MSSPILTSFVLNPDLVARPVRFPLGLCVSNKRLRDNAPLHFKAIIPRVSPKFIKGRGILSEQNTCLFFVSLEINVSEKERTPYAMPTLTKFAHESFSIRGVSSKDRRYSIIHP